MSNNIYVDSQTKENYKETKKITSQQWKVYYGLLSMSKYNSQKRENHRYVYRNSFNVSKFCKEFKIGRSTFYSAIPVLKKYGLVQDMPEYYLLYSRNWIDINLDILKALLTQSKDKDCYIDLLRTFLSLKKMLITAQVEGDNQFTIRDMCLILGHNGTDDDTYYNVRFYLALMSQWKMIELKTHTAYKAGLGSYTVYHLQSISETDLDPSFYTDLQADKVCTVMTEERLDELKFVYPEIVGEL